MKEVVVPIFNKSFDIKKLLLHAKKISNTPVIKNEFITLRFVPEIRLDKCIPSIVRDDGTYISEALQKYHAAKFPYDMVNTLRDDSESGEEGVGILGNDDLKIRAYLNLLYKDRADGERKWLQELKPRVRKNLIINMRARLMQSDHYFGNPEDFYKEKCDIRKFAVENGIEDVKIALTCKASYEEGVKAQNTHFYFAEQGLDSCVVLIGKNRIAETSRVINLVNGSWTYASDSPFVPGSPNYKWIAKIFSNPKKAEAVMAYNGTVASFKSIDKLIRAT